jgi:predicted dehydrogenase
VASSRDRVEGYTRQLRDEFGVTIVDSIDELLKQVDVVLLESVDGRPHLAQARPVLKAGKPVFIDKPVAATLADAMRIYKLAEETGTPCFSSSSLRFSPSILGLRDSPEVGEVLGCTAYSPCSLEEHHQDLFWYGIHGVESLYTVMGTGCVSVTRVQTEGTELAVGTWKDGRVGTFRGIRSGKADYGALAFGSKGIVHGHGYGGYEPLLVQIGKFFRTGKPPVSAAETLEIVAFMEAAQVSKQQGGGPVTIESVMARAREQVAREQAARDCADPAK